MKQIKRLLLTLGFAMFIAAPVMTVVVPQTTKALTADSTCEVRILGIPPWYKGLAQRTNGDCSVIAPGSDPNGLDLKLSDFIWRIVMNVIEIGLFLVGYIAVFFVLYGGFQYLTGGDNATKIESARKTILNALIGLGISIGSVVVINLIFGIFAK